MNSSCKHAGTRECNSYRFTGLMEEALSLEQSFFFLRCVYVVLGKFTDNGKSTALISP
jgi:hypothetical protein